MLAETGVVDDDDFTLPGDAVQPQLSMKELLEVKGVLD